MMENFQVAQKSILNRRIRKQPKNSKQAKKTKQPTQKTLLLHASYMNNIFTYFVTILSARIKMVSIFIQLE